jgi:uncharacterized small protein (DUF1192 family)
MGNWGRIMRVYDPNMNAEDKVVFHLGKAEGGPAAEIGFLYRGDQAGNNVLFLGHYGKPYILNITKAGWVGINTNNPQRRLHIEGNVYVEGYMGIGVLNLGPTYRLHVKGMGVFADTAVRVRDLVSPGGNTVRVCRNQWDVLSTCPSCSRRYKEDIKPLSVRKEDVLSLQPVSFKWKNTNIRNTGLIAEDVAQKFPELVYTDDKGELYGIHYDRLSIYLLPVVKEQEERISALRKKIQQLKQELKELETQNDEE